MSHKPSPPATEAVTLTPTPADSILLNKVASPHTNLRSGSFNNFVKNLWRDLTCHTNLKLSISPQNSKCSEIAQIASFAEPQGSFFKDLTKRFSDLSGSKSYTGKIDVRNQMNGGDVDQLFMNEVQSLVKNNTIQNGTIVVSDTGHDVPNLVQLLKSGKEKNLNVQGALRVLTN